MHAAMELDLELDAALEDSLITSTETTTQDQQVKLVSDEAEDRFQALPRPTAIFLHGVDDMSTKDITAYCNHADMIKVEWINDSACNLAFTTEEQAQEALSCLVADIAVEVNHKELVPANPYVDNEGRSHALFVRISTDEDVKERGARERSRYYQIHGTEKDEIPKEKQQARREHYDRMSKNGGDGRSVFSRLGNKRTAERRSSRSLSPTNKEERSIKREHSVEREIPAHLKSRLGLSKENNEEEIVCKQEE